MTACQFYFVLSAVLVLISDNFFPVFKEEYSVWLVPLLFVAIFIQENPNRELQRKYDQMKKYMS